MSLMQQVLGLVVSHQSLGRQKFFVKRILGDMAVIMGFVIFMMILIGATLTLLMMALYQFMLAEGMTQTAALLTLTGSSLAVILVALGALSIRVRKLHRLTDTFNFAETPSSFAGSVFPPSVTDIGRSFFDGFMGRVR